MVSEIITYVMCRKLEYILYRCWIMLLLLLDVHVYKRRPTHLDENLSFHWSAIDAITLWFALTVFEDLSVKTNVHTQKSRSIWWVYLTWWRRDLYKVLKCSGNYFHNMRYSDPVVWLWIFSACGPFPKQDQ